MKLKKTDRKNKPLFRNSIKVKLTVVFCVPVLLMVLLVIIIYNKATDTITQNYENATLSTLNEMADYLDLGFAGVQTNAIAYINDTNLQAYYQQKLSGDKVAETAQFKATKSAVSILSSADGFINNIFIFGDYGNDITTLRVGNDAYQTYMGSDEGKAWENRKSNFIWAGYHPSLDQVYKLDTDTYSISLIYKMSSKKGFVVMDIEKEQILQLLKKLDLGAGGKAGFVTGDNRETSINSEEEYFTKQDFYQELVSAKETSKALYKEVNGKKYLILFSRIKSADSLLYLMIPEEQILSKMDSIRTLTILFTVITIIISMGIGMLFAADISNVLGKIGKEMKKIAGGNLNGNLKIKRKDEFGVLVDDISEMILSVKTLLQKAIQVSENISEFSALLGEDSNEILSASKNIMSAVKEIDTGIQINAEGTQTCLSQMAELAYKIDSIFSESSIIETAIKSTRNVTEKGNYIILDLNEKSKKTNEITKDIITEIMELQQQTQLIDNIVVMISEIAQQTNLLSLNASIEAARAGISGRGFVVVAAEVRKLAEQSVEAVEKIQNIISIIQIKTQKAVISVREAGENISSQTDSLVNTTEIFEEIRKSVEILVTGIYNTTGQIREIEAIKVKTLGTIEEFSAIAQENSASSEEIANIVENQLSTAQKLNNTARVLSEDEKNLYQAIGKFLI